MVLVGENDQVLADRPIYVSQQARLAACLAVLRGGIRPLNLAKNCND